MTSYNLMNMLGKAFSNGEIDALGKHLAKNCVYWSDYANRKIESAKKIISGLKEVYSELETDERYTYSVVPLNELVDLDRIKNLLDSSDKIHLVEQGLLLYQGGNNLPVAVVIAGKNKFGKICEIKLSRDKDVFDMKFYGEFDEPDSPYDLPSTVTPLTPRDRQVKELQRAFSGQHLEDAPKAEEDNLYIWRQADLFIKDFLKRNGYSVYESQIFDDCIGYHCSRNGTAYAVYMLAYGQEMTTWVDEEYCQKFSKKDFSYGCTILIVYLHVKRYHCEDGIEYKVFTYGGKEDPCIEIWKLSEIAGKTRVQYFTREEMMRRVKELIYAFNHDSMDVYDCIICEHNPSILEYGATGYVLNRGFYGVLTRLHNSSFYLYFLEQQQSTNYCCLYNLADKRSLCP